MVLIALAEHAGYALLVAALLAPRLRYVRLLLLIFALVALARLLATGAAPVALAWPGLLAILAAGLLLHDWLGAGRVRFSAEEERMAARLLPGVAPAQVRHLIDQGLWLNGEAGDMLTLEGEPVGHLYFLSEGEARVVAQGREVGACRAGDLIGELTVLTGEPASATVTLTGPARFWCASAAQLRPYLAANEEVGRAVERSIAEALKAKLRASNRIIAQAGGVPKVG
jgi:hypothetical protein